MTPIFDICRNLPECHFAAGELVLTEGVKDGGLLFLISGEVEILKNGIQIATVSEPGAIFGEISVLLDVPHMATVKALTETRFHCAENPQEFARTHPEVYQHIATLLAQRLQLVTSHLIETQLQLKSKTEHALMHRLMQALQHSLAPPAS